MYHWGGGDFSSLHVKRKNYDPISISFMRKDFKTNINIIISQNYKGDNDIFNKNNFNHINAIFLSLYD